MFIDRARIFVKGGKGGRGCQSFYRDKLMRPPHGKNRKIWRGRPDGGDGGNGGNVVVMANSHLWSLLDFKYRQHFSGQDGKHGSSNKRRGEDGKDIIIKVPVGTIITNAQIGYLLSDLNEDGKSLVVGKGGVGGIGNARISQATEGKPGEERLLDLELKLISDIAIIGFPNAGKSSLIRCISNAESKVASYPFTTKSPILGVVDFGDNRLIAADMPGLIKDAHKGKGLGLQFLKHISRTRALLHVIDMSGEEVRDPIDDYHALVEELKLFDEELIKKPQLVVANKMDLESSPANLERFCRQIHKKIIPISCLKKEGINVLLKEMKKLLRELK